MISRFAFIAALLVPSLALADTAKATDKATAAKLSDNDTAIIAHEHAVNQTEIDMGKLAQKTGSADVKAYGVELVADHTAADKDLVAYAKDHGLKKIPADKPDPTETKANDEMMTKLKLIKGNMKAKDGSSFDTMFLDTMVDAHTKEITKLDAAVQTSPEPGLKALLDGVRPVMKKHATEAADLDTKIKGGKA